MRQMKTKVFLNILKCGNFLRKIQLLLKCLSVTNTDKLVNIFMFHSNLLIITIFRFFISRPLGDISPHPLKIVLPS